jgi:hypothetical protein
VAEVDEEADGGVAVVEMVEEGWAVWGWELADELFEFCVPGGVRRPRLGPSLALGHWDAPHSTLFREQSAATGWAL